MSARGAGASARTGRHEDACAEPDILLDTAAASARRTAGHITNSTTQTKYKCTRTKYICMQAKLAT